MKPQDRLQRTVRELFNKQPEKNTKNPCNDLQVLLLCLLLQTCHEDGFWPPASRTPVVFWEKIVKEVLPWQGVLFAIRPLISDVM